MRRAPVSGCATANPHALGAVAVLVFAIASSVSSCHATGFYAADTRVITPALVAEYTDKKCAFYGKEARRAPDDQCGPFPCGSSGCVVLKCGPGVACYDGFCSNGYCRRASWSGGNSCPSEPDRDVEPSDYAGWSGCSCRRHSESDIGGTGCLSFPCTEHGCYVHRCGSDGDCAIGVCAKHTGSPTDYCVTSDAY